MDTGLCLRRLRRENRRLIAYMEQLAEHYTEPQLERLTDIFVDCSHYEGMFWEMAWNGEL